MDPNMAQICRKGMCELCDQILPDLIYIAYSMWYHASVINWDLRNSQFLYVHTYTHKNKTEKT